MGRSGKWGRRLGVRGQESYAMIPDGASRNHIRNHSDTRHRILLGFKAMYPSASYVTADLRDLPWKQKQL